MFDAQAHGVFPGPIARLPEHGLFVFVVAGGVEFEFVQSFLG